MRGNERIGGCARGAGSMAWPTWLVPPSPSPASTNRCPITASPSSGALPALSGAGDAPASPSRSLTVVKPRATRPIAPLHDLKPGGGEPWLVGRWLKWSQDKLNALDKSTAEALPAVERDVKRRVGRVALAITQEYVHQFPPLEVYLADRAFEMDEMRNAAIRAKLAERDAKATSGANENQTEDAREKDEDEPASPEPTEAKTEPESRAPETTPSTASKQPSASKNARRKLTDFFFAGGHAAAVQAATDAREETKMVPTKISPTKISPTKELTRTPPSPPADRRETNREREERWAREGAALAASLAAPRRTRRASSSRARRSKPTDENAPQPRRFAPDRIGTCRIVRACPGVPRRRRWRPWRRGRRPRRRRWRPRRRRRSTRPRRRRWSGPRVAEAPKTPATIRRPPAREVVERSRRGGRCGRAERERNARRDAPRGRLGERLRRRREYASRATKLSRGPRRKWRAPRRVDGVGVESGVAGAKGPYVDMLSRLRSAARSTAKAWNELAGETFDGGVEFRAAGASTGAGGDKVRLESVVTMSVDGADVLVQTREVSVAGKQS